MIKDWNNNFYQDVITPKEKLKHLAIDLKSKSVIDLGCNIGEVKPYVFDLGASSYIGYDSNKDYIDEAIKRNGLGFREVNILNLLFQKTDIVFALGLFHHLSDDELKSLIKKIDCEILIIESPTKGISKNYNIRTIEKYQELLKPYNLKETAESGFKTPPVDRKILVFTK